MLAASVALGLDLSYPDYATFLKEFVCKGGVAYEQIRANQPELEKAKADFSSMKHDELMAASKSTQIAFYVNLYNLYTIDLIVRHLPLKKGIKDINGPWAIKFIPLFGDTVSLDHIEHEILRKEFKEPRIHFTLVCASKSCPVLSEKPYRGDSLNTQLDLAARRFLSDTTRNRFTANASDISKIFDWYGDDFKPVFGSATAFISKIVAKPVSNRVHFNDYDWSLNRVDKCE